MIDEVVSKSAFAQIVGVSAARVSKWLADGKISGDALVGRGHRARIRVAVAQAQLKRNLDPVQFLGANGRAQLNGVVDDDTIETSIKVARLQQLELSNAKAAAEAAARSGRYTKTEDARQEQGRVAARLMSVFEASLTEFAAAILAEQPKTQRDALRTLRAAWRTIRVRQAKASGEEAAATYHPCSMMRTTMLIANARRLGLETVAAALEPPPPISYLTWAERNIVFDEGQFPGPYNRDAFPFWDGVLQALGPDDPCRTVTLMASAQVGKTVLGEIFCLATLAQSRGSFLVVHPTIENALRWSKMKLAPLMRSTAVVRAQFPQRANDTMSSILYKERKDGLSRLLVTGANSPASLSQVTIENQVQDDVSKFEINAMGDPELMADSRSRAISDAKIFKISTPLIEPGCRITRNFRDGSQEHPYVACPHCSTMMILEPDNFLTNIDPANPDDAHFVCASCGAAVEEHHRPQMLRSFEWRAHNPSAAREHRSFWIWSAYSYLQSWPQIAREWLKAKGDPASEKTFWNDALGKAYETRSDGRPWEELAARAAKSSYARGTVPKGALILTLGIDVQTDRTEWQLLGHGEHYQRFVIDVGTIGKHISEPDAQRNLDLLLERKWPNTFGRDLGISLAAIDAGFSTDDVLAYVRRHGPSKLIAVRGMPGDAVPRIAKVRRERDEKRGTILKFSNRFFNVGVNNFKFALYKDLAKDDATAPGYISFPRDLPDSYFQELAAERRVAHKRFGQIVWHWEKPDRQPNEAMDTFVYASAAAIKHGVNWISDVGWQRLRAQREAPTDDKPQGEAKSSIASQLAGVGPVNIRRGGIHIHKGS